MLLDVALGTELALEESEGGASEAVVSGLRSLTVRAPRFLAVVERDAERDRVTGPASPVGAGARRVPAASEQRRLEAGPRAAPLGVKGVARDREGEVGELRVTTEAKVGAAGVSLGAEADTDSLVATGATGTVAEEVVEGAFAVPVVVLTVLVDFFWV